MHKFISNHLKYAWIILLLISIVIFINPIRETTFTDDWAYARTVEKLLKDGQYKLNDWAAASMPFQIAYGALLSKIFGYSLSILILSTLSLSIFGIVGFYFLAKEYNFKNELALLLTFILASSPLVLHLSFTYMTDIPFLSLFIWSVLFYTKTLKTRKNSIAFIASLFASCAILTRQNGYILPLGISLIFLIDKNRFRNISYYVSGLLLPMLSLIYQVFNMSINANWAAKYIAYTQSQYLSNLSVVIINFFIRIPVIMIYLSISCLPLIIFTFVDFSLRTKNNWLVKFLCIVTVIIAVILNIFADFLNITFFGRITILTIGLFYACFFLSLLKEMNNKKLIHPLYKNFNIGKDIILSLSLSLMTLLGITYLYKTQNTLLLPYLPWNFEILKDIPVATRILLTLFSAFGGIFIFRLLILNFVFFFRKNYEKINYLLFFHFIMGISLITHLAYYQLGDEYLILYLPYVLIMLGVMLEKSIIQYKGFIIISSFLVLIAGSFWTRAMLDRSQANWMAAEYLRKQGIPTNDIFAPWTWIAYWEHDNYLKSRNFDITDGHRDFFERYIQRENRGKFLVLEDIDSKYKYKILKQFPYRDIFLRKTAVLAVEKL